MFYQSVRRLKKNLEHFLVFADIADNPWVQACRSSFSIVLLLLTVQSVILRNFRLGRSRMAVRGGRRLEWRPPRPARKRSRIAALKKPRRRRRRGASRFRRTSTTGRPPWPTSSSPPCPTLFPSWIVSCLERIFSRRTPRRFVHKEDSHAGGGGAYPCFARLILEAVYPLDDDGGFFPQERSSMANLASFFSVKYGS